MKYERMGNCRKEKDESPSGGVGKYFFSCIAERARGMVGQLSRNAKAKNVKQELHAGVISPAKKAKQNQSQTTQTQQPHTKRAGENPRKRGETRAFFFELMPCALEAQTVIKTYCL